MKRIWVTVKELAQEFGVSHDVIPAPQPFIDACALALD